MWLQYMMHDNLEIFSWTSHNRFSATYIQYPWEDAKFSCGHAKQWRPSTTNQTLLPYRVMKLGLYVGSLNLKTGKDIRAPLQDKNS